MTFEGNPLWLVGIAAFVIGIIWFTIKACFQVERQDEMNGRKDLDEDSHLPFH